ncbi:MAG: alpha/beta hydrolase [Lacipirellulaceae bacterium]
MLETKTRIALVLLLWLPSTLICPSLAPAGETFLIWPDLAPGETTKQVGVPMPADGKSDPPIVRLKDVTSPKMEVFLPEGKSSGAAVLILPGGGYNYVVPNLEGSELATKLNEQGITAFVLNYRTKNTKEGPHWKRPLADSRRAMRVIRSRAAEWKLDPAKLGLVGFSAGGQLAAIHLTNEIKAYEPIDAIDEASAAANFALLIYPWQMYDKKTDRLIPEIVPDEGTPPTFIVHTHDDKSTSLGAVLFYSALKKSNVPGELHVYTTGGHGYGTRPRNGSVIHTWPDRAVEWLRLRGLTVPN